MQTLLILCKRRDIPSLLDALEDWQGTGDTLLHGYTGKQQEGFILMQWNGHIPERFRQMQLAADPGIIDYLIVDLSLLPVIPPPATA
jgi:pyridoxal/pyridoxine/pyridoxamine kinase